MERESREMVRPGRSASDRVFDPKGQGSEGTVDIVSFQRFHGPGIEEGANGIEGRLHERIVDDEAMVIVDEVPGEGRREGDRRDPEYQCQAPSIPVFLPHSKDSEGEVELAMAVPPAVGAERLVEGVPFEPGTVELT